MKEVGPFAMIIFRKPPGPYCISRDKCWKVIFDRNVNEMGIQEKYKSVIGKCDSKFDYSLRKKAIYKTHALVFGFSP